MPCYRISAIFLLVPLVVSACNSSSSGDSNNPVVNDSTSTTVAQPDALETSAIAPNKRLKTLAITGFGFNEDVDTYTLAYNADGTIDTINYVSANFPEINYVVTHAYENGLLTQRADNLVTETFTYRNGNVVRATHSFKDDTAYTYSASDQLVGVTGEAFLFDDDCLIAGQDADVVAPEYTIIYDSAGRPTSIQGTYGDTINYQYRDDGQLESFEVAGDCSIFGSGLSTITYDSQGRPIGAFSNIGLETTTASGSYTGNQLSQEIEVVQSDGIEINRTTDYTYDTDGLLLEVATTSRQTPDGDSENYSVVQTYTYEDGACVEQISTDPAKVLLLSSGSSLLAPRRSISCGYYVDSLI